MSASGFDRLMVYALLGTIGLVGMLVLRRSPRAATIILLCSLAFIPVWIGVSVFVYWQTSTLACGVVIVGLLSLVRIRQWTSPDLILLALVLFVAAEFALGTITLSAAFTMFTTWGFGYLAARLLADAVDLRWIYGAVSVVFAVAAGLALIEAATSINPFITYLHGDAELYRIWGTQQIRGGVARAEGAFGHSIALGCSMAMGIALALGSRFRNVIKIVLVLVMAAAVVASFSRTGMLASALAAILMVACNRDSISRRFKVGLLAVGAVAALGALFVVRGVFQAAGSETSGSAQYRSLLLELVSAMAPFGLTAEFARSSSGNSSIGPFGSIDNAFLLFGLTYGWVPMLLLIPLLVGAVVIAVRRRASPPVVAVISQFPALITVALITQYAVVLWFVIGLAVSSQLPELARSRPVPKRTRALRADTPAPPVPSSPLPVAAPNQKGVR